jgi:hypothetical protein
VHYNTVRLHSAIDFVAPADKLAGQEHAILAARDHKLEQARERRKRNRDLVAAGVGSGQTAAAVAEDKCDGAEDRATQGCDPSADSVLLSAGGGRVRPALPTIPALAESKAINPKGSGEQRSPGCEIETTNTENQTQTL